MKTSNIILLSLLLLVLGTITAVAVSLRVKEANHWYVNKGTTYEIYSDVPLGPFSIIAAEGLDNVTIQQGSSPLLRLSERKGARPAYKLDGDTLKVWGTADNSHEEVRVTVSGLTALSLKKVGDFSLTRYKGDSLNITSDGDGTTGIDSSDLRKLHLQLGQGSRVTLSNSSFGSLWPAMDSSCTLNLENDRIHWMGGHWAGDATLQIDGATLRNGLDKIEYIP